MFALRRYVRIFNLRLVHKFLYTLSQSIQVPYQILTLATVFFSCPLSRLLMKSIAGNPDTFASQSMYIVYLPHALGLSNFPMMAHMTEKAYLASYDCSH